MRLSTLLQVGAVSTFVLSPAMAQQVQDVHEQALKILRAQSSGEAVNTPATTAPAGQPGGEAGARELLRQSVLESDRQQTEQMIQERERVRQRQREYDERVVREAGLSGMNRTSVPGSIDDIHARALSILRGETPPGATSTGREMPAGAARPATTASSPNVVQALPAGGAVQTPAEAASTHAQALEILRQQMQGAQTQTEAVAQPSTSPGPSPEIRDRVRDILNEQAPARRPQAVQPSGVSPEAATPEEVEARAREVLRQKAAQNGVATAASAEVEAGTAAVEDVHAKALQVLRQQQPAGSPVTARSVLSDPKTQEMMRRMDAEAARNAGAPKDRPAPTTHSPVVVAVPSAGTLNPEAEQRAREILRQQTAATASPAPAVEPAREGATYSRELEERARQTLAERAQTQQTATPAAQPLPTQAAPAAVPPARPSASAPREAAPVVQPSPSITPAPAAPSAAMTKREKLEELNALYRADKLTPAEYHERRAKILAGQ